MSELKLSGSSESVGQEYAESLERARKECPTLIKRMSNKLSGEDKQRLIDPTANEFNPHLQYPNLFDLSPEDLEMKKSKIHADLSVVSSIEASGYRPTITEEIDKQKALLGLDNVELLELAQAIVKDGPSDELKACFVEQNIKKEGQIDIELYQGLINHLHLITASIKEDTPNAWRIGQELQRLLPPLKGSAGVVVLPEQTFEKYSQAYETIFRNWIEKIIPKNDESFDAQGIAAVFDSAITDMKFDEQGWKVTVDDSATSIKISMEDKEITIPSDRQPIKREELAGRVVHEIGHITRGWNGSFISRSAEHGLPEYLDAEEGLMAYGEQFMQGKQSGNSMYMERYIGAGLMTGSLDGQEKDFKAVFSAMWRSRVLLDNHEKIKQGKDISHEDIKTAREMSLMNATRLFRGGDGKTPGLGWTKDKTYYEGMAKLTDFLIGFEKKYGVENIHLLFAAKFDPTQSLHNRYLGMPPLENIHE